MTVKCVTVTAILFSAATILYGLYEKGDLEASFSVRKLFEFTIVVKEKHHEEHERFK